MVPGDEAVYFVMGHAVNDHILYEVVFCVIDLSVCVKIAVAYSCCPFPIDAVADG